MEGQGDIENYDATFIEQPAILDKHKAAAVIVDAAIEKAIGLCVDGGDVSTICGTIDAFIAEELTKTFSNKKSKKLERGISFPCTLSINEIAGHFSPCPEDTVALKNGDLVKIECGAHIDGFSSNAAHTIVVGGKSEGKQADVVLAAWNAFQAAAKTIRIGGLNQTVTANIQAVCDDFGVNPLQGVLSHKMKKHLCDGNEVIINKETPEMRVDDWEFAPGDIIALDVYVSSGEGMGKEADCRTTVFKREMDTQYNLKSKSAREFFHIVNEKYPTLPFSIRGFENLTAAKVGVKECMAHDLIMPYPVLTEKAGEFVA
jgi:curved DNA binding protein